jgi:hypothetical protein
MEIGYENFRQEYARLSIAVLKESAKFYAE